MSWHRCAIDHMSHTHIRTFCYMEAKRQATYLIWRHFYVRVIFWSFDNHVKNLSGITNMACRTWETSNM